MMYKGGGGIYLNLIIQNVVRQNALIRVDLFRNVTLIHQLQCRNNVQYNMNAKLVTSKCVLTVMV